mgnify:CR=1 FL=1
MFKTKLKSKFLTANLLKIVLLGDLNMLITETYSLHMILFFNTSMNLTLIKEIFSVLILKFSKSSKISDHFPSKDILLNIQMQKKAFYGF